MIVEIKIPTPGESITEVEITNWMVNDGDMVVKNQELAEIESDKATLSMTASESGKIHIVLKAGTNVKVNTVACTIDTDYATQDHAIVSKSPEVTESKPVEQPLSVESAHEHIKISPVAQQMMAANQLSIEDVLKGLHRISAQDINRVMEHMSSKPASSIMQESQPISRATSRQKMSPLRKKLAQRLVAVKNETAMLTTFNEVDMTAVMALRSQYGKVFLEKHNVKLGLMSFFIKAAAMSLKLHPAVNSMIDSEEVITPQYADISVAVQTPKGLMVPVIRNAETLTLAQIEQELKELAEKARTGKISLDEMSGGTFTITNGGVFGSMLSTPLINPPQSAILGMHNISDRPMAVNGRVEIRPIMYVALSYDHRIIDGKDSVGFLKKIKELIEQPSGFLIEGKDPDKLLLGI
jgi:2-oxoglutarate dehydrogenase E2 component (dihydrolipoamide succinyltransferase)